MSKLVDKERLAKLAKALNDRAKAAVKAEETRALQAESRIEGKADANATAIAAINNAENGILKQAQNYVDAAATELDKRIQTKVSTTEYEAKVTELANKDKEMADDILGLDTAVKAIENKMGDGDLNLPAIDKAIKDFKDEQQGVDAQQNQDIVAAQEAADKAQKDVDAVVGRLDNEGGLVDRLEAVEEFAEAHSHADMEADITALDGRVDQLEVFKEAHSHEDMEEAIAALQELHKEGGVVDGKVSEVREAVEDLQAEVTEFKEAQEEKEQAQDEAIAAKVAQAAYDEKVAALEKADTDLDQAIKDEAARALAAEQALGQRIDAIVGEEDGLLAQAKALVDAEKDAREAADEELQGQIDDAVEAAGLLEGRVAANEAKLAGLKKETVQGAIDDAEANAKAHAEAKIAELVDSAPEAMDTLNELAKAIKDNKDVYDGYIAEHATAMAQQKADLQKEIDDDIAAAKVEISAEIDADVKAEADRAKAEEADIRADFAAADATLKAELQEEMGGIQSSLEEAMTEVIGEFRDECDGKINAAKQEAAAAVLAEENRAKGEESRIEEAYKAADVAMNQRIAAVELIVGSGGESNALDVINGKIAALEQEDKDLAAEDLRLQGAIDAKVAQADYDVKVAALVAEDERLAGLAKAAQDDVDAVEGRMSTAEGKITTLEGFMNAHSHEAMEAQIELNKEGVADNKAAIEKEVEDRAAAIEEALKPYATEAETLAVIGNVVNSLALSMENNQVVLKLGGVEGVALTSVHLDMVTDADIDEIIAGLDAVDPTGFNF